MQRPVWQFVLLVLVATVALMTNLGGSRLWDRDETRNAGCAAEMMQRRDWVVPMFNHELRDAKPVLLYWLIMSAYSVFGVNEFAARFPSALLGLGTVVATYVMARRLFNSQVALFTGIILATSIMFEVAGHAATPDAPLIFCSTLAVMIFVLATFRPRTSATEQRSPPELRAPGEYFPAGWPAVAAMYAVMGVGILAKGPVGLILPTAVIGMFLLIVYLPARQSALAESATGRQRLLAIVQACLRPFAPRHFVRTCWRMRLITATIVALAVAAPWYIWVGYRTNGDFLRGFFIDEHFGRATRAMESHSGGPLYYLVALLIGFFPWSVFLVPILTGAIARIRRGDPWRTGYLLATCWVAVYVVLFTMAATKLPSYVTPCYPGLAMLGGCFLYHLLRGTILAPTSWLRFGLAVLVLVGLVVAIGLPIAATFFLPGEHLLGAIGLIPITGALVCFWMLRRGYLSGMVLSFATTAVVMMVTVFGFGMAQVDRHRHSFELLETVRRRGPDTKIGAFGGFEPSLVFYSGRRIEPLVVESEVNARQPADARKHVVGPRKNLPTVAAFLEHNHDAVLITTGRSLPRLADSLPKDVEILGEVPRFLRRDTLILLGRRRAAVETATVSHPGSLQ